jgi:NAD(P)-dependent dehydrogenase (short-subunit alcohol dehydrogenase family)
MKSKKNYFNFSNVNALVTGSTGNLGLEISKCLAEHGANVFLNGRNKKKILKLNQEIKKKGHKSQPAIFDITNQNLVKKFFLKNKSIGIIVNNAYEGKTGNFQKFSSLNYKKAFESNILSTANIINESEKALINSLKKTGYASIINVSSIYGSFSPDPSIYDNTKLDNPPYYGVVKAGLQHLTRYAAINLAKHNIRVNSISPGPFPNNLIKKKYPKFINKLKKKVPIDRVGNPDEINTAILFLSSKYTSFVTGINIPIDGGWSAW